MDDVQTFLRVIYGDDGFFFARFHAEASDDPKASIPPWNPTDGSRTVTFTKTMSLPSVIERLLSLTSTTAALTFEEKQWFRYDPASGMACVRSTPVLVSPRSESFKTEVTVYLSPFGDDRAMCAMQAKLRVTAVGTWALQPVVEKMMEHRASALFREWVRYADTFLSENYGGSANEDRPLPKLSLLKNVTPPENGRRARYPSYGRGTPAEPPKDEENAGGFGGTSRRQGSTAASLGAVTAAEELDEGASSFSDADEFDDAKSVASKGSGSSLRSFRSENGGVAGISSANGHAVAPAGWGGVGRESVGNGEANRRGVEDDDEGPSSPSARTALAAPSLPSVTLPSPRPDDVYANSWFMQTVLKDLGCLRAAARDQKEIMAALEENVCALRAEAAALRAEMRRLGGGGGGGGGGTPATGRAGGSTPAVPTPRTLFPSNGAHRADRVDTNDWGWSGGGGAVGGLRTYAYVVGVVGCAVGVGFIVGRYR